MTQLMMLFAMMLLLSSLFINGWYNITRGQWHIKPDGTKYWDGKIFSGYSKFLQRHTEEIKYYLANELLKEFAKIKPFFTNSNDEIIEFYADAIVIKKMDEKKQGFLLSYAVSHGVEISVRTFEKEPNKMLLSIYTKVKKYKIPNWAQRPLGECLACMSSVYGTLCWFVLYAIAQQVQNIYPTDSVRLFIEMPLLSKGILWIAFCITLAYLNELIFNINHKLQS